METGQLPAPSHLLSKQEDTVQEEGSAFPEGPVDFSISHCPFLIRKEARKEIRLLGHVLFPQNPASVSDEKEEGG